MKLPRELQRYHEPLESLQKLISRFNHRGVVIGGIAASVLGEARYTEDLIIMKAIAHRPKDLEDIRTLAIKYTNLELAHIERWIKDFAEILETPELWGQIEKILKQQE